MTILTTDDLELTRDTFADPESFPTEFHDSVVNIYTWANEQLSA